VSRRYSAGDKLALIRAYEASDKEMRIFCAGQGLSTASLCKWRRQYAAHGDAGLAARRNPRNARGAKGRRHTPEERLAAVAAFERSGVTQQMFAKRWGVSVSTLCKWRRRLAQGGGRALVDGAGSEGPAGPSGGSQPGEALGGGTSSRPAPSEAQGLQPRRGPGRRIAASTEAAIVAAKREQPRAGLRRIRDLLRRFLGLSVSTGAVRRVLKDHGLHDPDPPRARKRRPLPRRFERARPGQLWQSDITSYVLARPGRRVYLTLFLDDHSRYIVAWRLLAHQRNELVLEALEEGLLRYGKPTEILTDRGPQYHSWRGKSAFRKRLEHLGIGHVLAAARHPQTVGKCERLWKTISEELWERVRPDDLSEAQRRLGHWIAHYNFFRPHQGIDGCVPADRFFGAEDALRATLSGSLSDDELGLALGDPLRQPVYLFGRIGGRSVSLHGEGGQLVLETDGEPVARVPLAQMGMPSPEASAPDDDPTESRDEQGQRAESLSEPPCFPGRDVVAGAAGGELPDRDQGPPSGPQADGLSPDPEDAGAGARAVGVGQRGAADPGASDLLCAAGGVAGQVESGGGGGASGGESSAPVAAVAAGDGGYAGGTAETAQTEARDGETEPAAGRGSGEAEASHRGAGEGLVAGGRRDQAAAGAAGQQGSRAAAGDAQKAPEAQGQGGAGEAAQERPSSAVRGKKGLSSRFEG